LSGVRLSGVTLSPAFDPEQATYTAAVFSAVDSTIVTPTIGSPVATLTVNNAPGWVGSSKAPELRDHSSPRTRGWRDAAALLSTVAYPI
jgi:hypothetical protein